MGDLSEFPFKYRLFLKTYRWRRLDPVPWTPLRQPVEECRLVLLSSAGFVLPDQKPFDDSIKGGDWSFREIPSSTDASRLRECHRSDAFDHEGIRQDPNLAFPLDRVRELDEENVIGSVNHRHVSFMGSLTAPGRFVRETAPQVAGLLRQDEVDIALLVPV